MGDSYCLPWQCDSSIRTWWEASQETTTVKRDSVGCARTGLCVHL
jgi:hypothetical protein